MTSGLTHTIRMVAPHVFPMRA